MGTVAAATTECGWKRGDTGVKDNRAEESSKEVVAHQGESRVYGRRAGGAHEALPHTSPGGKPPETPGPLSLLFQYSEGRESVKGSQAAQKARALDRFPPFRRRLPGYQGKGANGTGASRLPLVGPETRKRKETA
jgi:hypothetical protein